MSDSVNFSGFDAAFGACLPIVDRKNSANRVIGSATLLFGGLFLTSWHNIEQYLKDHEMIDVHQSKSGIITATFEVDLLHFFVTENKMSRWSVGRIHKVNNTDIAILIARRLDGDIVEEVKSLHTAIDLHVPSNGSRLLSVGYPDSSSDNDGGTKTTHGFTLKKSSGLVQDYFPDKGPMVDGPCIHTNNQLQGGMSGGPVFNDIGELVGLNTASLETNDNHGSSNLFDSFIALIYPAFVHPIKLPINSVLTETTIREVVHKNSKLSVKGLSHIIIENNVARWDDDVQCESCK